MGPEFLFYKMKVSLRTFLGLFIPSLSFPSGSVVENPPASARDAGSIPGLGSSPGVGNGNPFQYCCLGNAMDRGAWWTTIHQVVKESDMTE